MFEQEIESIQEELEAIYMDLHRHPELGFNEHHTASVVAEYLRMCGIEVKTHQAMTGVVGVLDSSKVGPTLLLRADMDCLQIDERTECAYRSEYPGRMHACGHDTHVAMLLGAAKILSNHKSELCGKIKFVFEPAEEGLDPSIKDEIVAAGCQLGGARALVDLGILDDVDYCFIIHNEPALSVGTVRIPMKNAYAASDVFEITLQGKGGHGARPQNTIDPLPALAELIPALYSIPSREIPCFEPQVITIGSVETPGSVWNSVADRAVVTGGFRTFNTETKERYYQRIPEIAKGIAEAHRCSAKVAIRHGLDPTVNDPKLAGVIADVCGRLLGKAQVDYSDQPTMASESAGVYLSRKPGVILRLGSGDPVHELHNPCMLPDLNTLSVGVRVHTNVAFELLKEASFNRS